MELTRIYRTYTLTLDNNKKIIYNLDDNEVIGVSGKPVKNPPSSVQDIITDLLYKLAKEKMNNRKNWEEIINRVISYEVDYETKNILLRGLLHSDIEWVLQNWKKVLKNMLKIIKDEYFLRKMLDCYEDIRTFLTYYELTTKYIDIFSNIEVKRYFDHNKRYIEFFSEKTFRDIIRKEIKKEKKFIENQNKVIDFLGITDLKIISKNYGITFSNFNLYYYIGLITNKYAKIKPMLKVLSINDYKITDIYTDYDYIVSLYNEKQMENDNKYFKVKQTEKNLFFENEKYKIYVPTSRQELRKIGNTFNNCANGHEWEVYLSKNLRKLVVIVDKETKKYEVCCDINSHNGKICQYLTKNNTSVQNTALKNFKTEYQDYLTKIWKEVE